MKLPEVIAIALFCMGFPAVGAAIGYIAYLTGHDVGWRDGFNYAQAMHAKSKCSHCQEIDCQCRTLHLHD